MKKDLFLVPLIFDELVLPLTDIPSLVSNGICEVGLRSAIFKNEILPMMMISSKENVRQKSEKLFSHDLTR